MPATMSVRDYLTTDEIRELQETSNWSGLFTLAWNWALIFGAFAIAIIWTNPLTIVLGVVIIGGRQLGLGIINHDCAHNTLFSNRRLNEIIGHWLAGAPINTSLKAYRDYHLKHHRYAGTPNDPDIGFVHAYPVPIESLKRKFARDLTGRTGFRDTLRKLKAFKLSKNYPWLSFHLALFALLFVVGAPWAYTMWWAAEIFVYPAIVRLRQIGEHGTAINRSSLDPRDNTGTTVAPWWQRVLIAPNDVNYHLEHHMMAGVPPYRLKQAHQLLKERGCYDNHDCISYGYGDVLRRAVRRDDGAPT